MKNFTPQEIVSELDKYIVGQNNAKKSVAIALRNRWRRKQLPEDLRKEIIPKNILMIGPTGVGKTEIARRLALIDNAPFIKVEATKFTEVGYVGRDVEQIIRDLMEVSIKITTEEMKKSVKAKAYDNAINRIVDVLAGAKSAPETKKVFKEKLIQNKLDESEIEIEVKDKTSPSSVMDVPGMPGAQIGMLNIDNFLGREKVKNKKMTVKKALEVLTEEESESLIDRETLIAIAKDNVENSGIVFIDEIDKIASSSERSGAQISREGVQRDLLPIVEGTTVNTKHGGIDTDHILFIASGAFHLNKPSDLLPELQGRFPIRVELNALTKEDFKRILTEPKANLILQYKEMIATESVTINFLEEAIDEIAELTTHFNENIENIGARRLHTILENVLEDINYNASEQSGQTIEITREFVQGKINKFKNNMDLSKFVI